MVEEWSQAWKGSMQDVICRRIQSIGGASRQTLINFLLSGVYIYNIVNIFDTGPRHRASPANDNVVTP